MRQQKRLILFELILVFCLALLITNKAFGEWVLSGNHKVVFFSLYTLRVIIILHVLLLGLKYFHTKVIKQKSPDKEAKRTTIKTSILSLVCILEIAFMFIPQSQGNTQIGLGQFVWHLYYGHPLNELGFRDDTINTRKSKKKNFIFLGDSFTYGNGINKVENRFSNIIKNKNKNYEFFNFGMGDNNTQDELNNLQKANINSDVVVLQYYFNDIDKLEELNLASSPNKSFSLTTQLKRLFQGSFFFNFVFVNSIKFTSILDNGDFKKQIESKYNNPKILKKQIELIEQLNNTIKNKNGKLYVLFIPDMRDINFSNTKCYNKIIPELKKLSIPYLELNEEFKPYESKTLMVSSIDAHCNELANEIIAKKLLTEIPELK